MTTSAPPRHPLRRAIRSVLLRLVIIAGIGYLLLVLLVQPSNQRDWSPDQQRLATAEFDGDRVLVRNVRNAHYRSTTDYDVHWEDRRYDLRQLDSVWYVVEPFASWRG